MMIFLLLCVALFLLDFFLKEWIDRTYPVGETHPLLRGHVMFEKFYNPGAALGFLKEHPKQMKWLHRFIMLLPSAALVFLVFRGQKKDRLAACGLSLLTAGGLCNLVDREQKGHVVDYFWFPRKNRKRRIIYNISDFFVFLGAILTALSSLRK